MIPTPAIVWILGLLAFVPYGLYYLFFYAEKSQYALIIVFLLFWIFGYWAVVTPIMTILKFRRLLKMAKEIQSWEKFLERMREGESEEVIVEWLSSENKIPKFLAKKVYRHLLLRLEGSLEKR